MSSAELSAGQGLLLEIVNMEGVVWSGPVRVVTVPGGEGSFGILRGHTPLLTRLREGFVHLETPQGERISIYVSGGFVESQPHAVTVLADTAVRSADLDAARADAARQEAAGALHSELAGIDHAAIRAELAHAAAQWAHELRGASRNRPR
ncbi:MAG: ATP synthase F1 subunit epsilon [Comamonadaceae bacterium]|nr:MAG: ATP synthase F1 subunit epsilon [Comamonadaceae bacterium]